jgi:hypothetical protein
LVWLLTGGSGDVTDDDVGLDDRFISMADSEKPRLIAACRRSFAWRVESNRVSRIETTQDAH